MTINLIITLDKINLYIITHIKINNYQKMNYRYIIIKIKGYYSLNSKDLEIIFTNKNNIIIN